MYVLYTAADRLVAGLIGSAVDNDDQDDPPRRVDPNGRINMAGSIVWAQGPPPTATPLRLRVSMTSALVFFATCIPPQQP